MASFLHQLEQRLKVVHVQPHRTVQVSYGLSRHPPGVTLVPQETADHRTILLLNPGLVIFPVRPGTGELDAPIGAVQGEGVVDEHTVVVGVDAEHGKGQLPCDGLQSCHHQVLLPGQQGDGLGPAGADVGGHQTVDERTAQVVAAMGHQVDLQETRRGLIPVRKGANWNVATTLQVASALAPAGHRGPYGLQQPVQGRCTSGQQPLPHLRVQVQMAVSFHGLHQVRQRRFQTFPADAVRCLPGQDHRLTDRLVVDAPPPDYSNFLAGVFRLGQQPDAVLAMVTRNGDELIEDPALVLSGRYPIAVSYGCQQLPFSHLAHASCHTIASRIFGSMLFAAITS